MPESMTPHGALLRTRWLRTRNHMRHLRKDSAIKIAVVAVGLALVVTIGLWVSYQSFRFAENFVIGTSLNAKLIGLLFFALLVLVTLSTVLIAYTTLFIASETQFLFQHPIPPRSVLAVKAGEAISFSAWASLFLCYPVLISFGLLKGAPATYYFDSLLILGTFLAFAGFVGTTIALLLAPALKRLGPRSLTVLALVILAGLAWSFLVSLEVWNLDGENNLLILDRFMSGLRAMQSPYSPSRWATDAILTAATGRRSDVLFPFGLLAANTLIFLPILSLFGKMRYFAEWIERRSAHGGSRKRAARRGPRLHSGPIRALIAKDVRMFSRNPAQLSQSFLFLLLMILYSISLLRIPRSFVHTGQIRTFIHFANTGAVCMILSSFTSRFLFPLVSLEGKAFWALGLAPITRGLILRQKTLFGLAIAASLGLVTIVLSNLAIDAPPVLFATSVYTTVLAATCLTSLATGLGAAYPSFDEDNPARIAAGIGGTLNFFASALSVAVIVAIEAAPYFVLGSSPPRWSLLTSHGVALGFTFTVSFLALSAGGRALARKEF